jgi:hypothetical protein
MDGESDLGFGDRVTIFEGFKKVGKGQSQVGAVGSSGTPGVGVSLQHEGLCHVTEGFFDCLGANLPTLPEVASSSAGGKAQQ